MRTVIYTLLLASFFSLAAACNVGETSTPTSTPSPTPTSTSTPPQPQTRLEEALPWVPLEYADKFIEFADYATSRKLTGLEDVRGFEDHWQLDQDQRKRIYEGLRDTPSGVDFIFLHDELGLDLFALDLGIWHSSGIHHSPTFTLMEGGQDIQDISNRLVNLEFKETSYRGTTYYKINEDFLWDFRHPARVLKASFNRTALVDDQVLAAPATFILEDLVDVQKGDSPSLLESPPHLALVRAVGDGMVGGVFLTPEWVTENALGSFAAQWRVANVSGIYTDSTLLDQHLTGPDPWALLSPYSLALFGYRVQGDAEETVIALYYPDPSGAERDARELEKRWNSFHLRVKDNVPVAGSCSSLSATVEREEGSSLIVATCSVIRDTDKEGTVRGPGLWLSLLFESKLEFLALDLEEQKRAAEARQEEETLKGQFRPPS